MSGWRQRAGRLRPPQRSDRTMAGRLLTVLVFMLAGLLITVSAIAARGTDLRSDRSLSLRELITQQGAQNRALQNEIDGVLAQIEQLASPDGSLNALQRRLDQAALDASAAPMTGPGVQVSLMDAPPDVRLPGVSDDALIVHQQDIQAVVNALWAGGAEAVSIQGERVVSTTGIKCVGNTVVLHGVPYAPPYVIEAIGDSAALEAALGSAPAVAVYREYAEAYGLGYDQLRKDLIEMPGHSGALRVTHARTP